MALKILMVENGSTPNDEVVRLMATTKMNVLGYAIVDRTFDENGLVSNEFRHIYVLPDITLEKDQELMVFTGTGKNGKRKYSDSEREYFECYWGSDQCIWNDKGGDTATLIRYEVIDHCDVLALS